MKAFLWLQSITFEQPGIAARIRWTGAGEFISSSKLTTDGLRTIIRRVLKESSYRESAQKLGNAINRSGGINEAACIVEEVMCTRKPVIARPRLQL